MVKTIAIDLGHGVGHDRGAADGFILEETIIDEVGALVIAGLRAMDIDVVQTRPSGDDTMIVKDSLFDRVDKANDYKVDLFVSIHANAGEGEGSEIFTFGGKALPEAVSVLSNLVSLGFQNRGIKSSNLYVINKTLAPAMLIEICFTDTRSDVDLYTSIGAERIAKAIIAGVSGQVMDAIIIEPEIIEEAIEVPTSDGWISRLQSECNDQGFSDQPVDGDAGPKTLAGCPTLQYGSMGNVTKLLQEALNDSGYECGMIDGAFGNKTKQAVILYQASHGLVVDGVVGPRTWSNLLGL